MAQHGQQYGRQTDEYGNPIHQTDELGVTNMGQQHGTTGTAIGGEQMKTSAGGIGMGVGTGGGMGTGMQHNEHQGQGMLHRTGSGSSSSSEDDGEGGRRKKGLKEKIKEKLPGGGQEGQEHEPMQGTATTTTGYGQEGHQDEKKGIMDKIKEKLPGGHN